MTVTFIDRSQISFSVRTWTVAALAALPALGGCYDAESLLQARHDQQNVSKMAEVDLGEFCVSLPHMPGHAGPAAVDFHAFGQVARADQALVARVLKTRGPELRASMLVLMRTLTEEQLQQPQLEPLRAGIAQVVNGALDDKLVKNVGFYRYSPHDEH